MIDYPQVKLTISGTKPIAARLLPSGCCKGVGVRGMWNTIWDELREVAWLASVIGGLSVLGVGLAVALAAA